MAPDSDDAFDVQVPQSGPGCVECDQIGSWWWHLRRCTKCGHVGCCDQSLNTHARKHAAATGHPVIQTYEPGEEWFWDYVRNEYRDGPVLSGPTSHPLSQTAPGPAERLPANWRAILESR